MRLVRVTKGVEKALIGALLIAAIAWGFLYDYVLEDKPQPMQLQPFAQFIGGDRSPLKETANASGAHFGKGDFLLSQGGHGP
jgi:hypothetical protein